MVMPIVSPELALREYCSRWIDERAFVFKSLLSTPDNTMGDATDRPLRYVTEPYVSEG